MPILRHPDLLPSNIFVSKEGGTSISIDRENDSTLPSTSQARTPEQFHNFGDEDFENFRPPQLPANLNS